LEDALGVSLFELGPPSVWPTYGAFLDRKALHTEIPKVDGVALRRCHLANGLHRHQVRFAQEASRGGQRAREHRN
jgi:hypothetical protein